MNSGTTIHTLTMWEGQQQRFCGDAEFLPPKLSFTHEVSNKESVEQDLIRVFGQIWDIEFNTGFWFGKAFDNMDSALNFFNAFKEKYPDSKITIQEEQKVIRMQYC